jgi:putative transcriptional regulator
MMNDVFESIKRGLEQALEHAQGNHQIAIVHRPLSTRIDVATLRGRLGLTKQKFARLCGVSHSTLQRWERGDCQPRGTALALLKVMAVKPNEVINILSS